LGQIKAVLAGGPGLPGKAMGKQNQGNKTYRPSFRVRHIISFVAQSDVGAVGFSKHTAMPE
jgi:hypothetical protein